MVNVTLLLTDGIVLTLIFAAIVVGSILWNPRLWIQDFPEDIQALIPPKTPHEQRLTLLIGIPFFVVLFGGLGLTAARYGTDNGALWMMLHVYLAWQIVNLFDLVVIDWGGMHLVDPNNPPFAGTAGAKGYRDFRFHFVGFLEGSVMGLVLAPLTVAVVWFLIV